MSYTLDDFPKFCVGVTPAWKPARELYAEYLLWCNPHTENVDGIAKAADNAVQYPRSYPIPVGYLQGDTFESFCRLMISRFGGCWNRDKGESTELHKGCPRGILGIHACLSEEGYAAIYQTTEIPPEPTK